jgi:hypothetical protein
VFCVISYLRQLARHATGERVPGQPRPLLQPNLPGPAREASDTRLIEAYEEHSESHEETNNKPASATRPATPALNSSSQPTFTAPERLLPRQSADSSREPVRRNSAEAISAALPELRPRLDAIEVLLPAKSHNELPVGHEDRKAATLADQDDTATERERTTGRPAITATPSQPSPTRNDNRQRDRDDDGRKPQATTPAPEVHIHIGRVELTALQAPQAKSAPRSSGKKPMSLDDYLRQRDGRRS